MRWVIASVLIGLTCCAHDVAVTDAGLRAADATPDLVAMSETSPSDGPMSSPDVATATDLGLVDAQGAQRADQSSTCFDAGGKWELKPQSSSKMCSQLTLGQTTLRCSATQKGCELAISCGSTIAFRAQLDGQGRAAGRLGGAFASSFSLVVSGNSVELIVDGATRCVLNGTRS
ncbi:MAG: hypothetical protein H6707_14875 [Deltaproteobacteria bacterium]|nr:hypothetical protein [Deltaproteobacteria bacterium]